MEKEKTKKKIDVFDKHGRKIDEIDFDLADEEDMEIERIYLLSDPDPVEELLREHRKKRRT